MKEAPSRLATRCSSQIRDKPFISLGVAVVTGAAPGWFLKRR